ncbi:centrosomal protein of 70 kDa-like [Convolutriloba macropyga]|uniref:centrosomal protein of 70 kDa-like n=1 Tax=Convolutriloba macropyga TaxID=536237 RepID=UPI003F52025C
MRLFKAFEKEILHLKRKLKDSENEKALMTIENETRYTTSELVYTEKRVRILEALLRKNNIKVPSTLDNKSSGNKSSNQTVTATASVSTSNEPTSIDEIRYLNIETTRRYLKLFCDHLGVDDLKEVMPALRQMGEKNVNYQKMKKFIQEVTAITSGKDLPSYLTPGNKREAASRRTYNTCIQTLKLWSDELRTLKSLYQSINNLVSTVMPSQKILPLSDDLTTSDLINFVDSISHDNSKELGLDTTGADVKTLRDMVRHFQQLFDCPHLQGVYPRMNEVFSKLEESRNTINTFKDLLGLDLSSTSTRTLIGAFEAVCREFNNRTYDQLKTLISSDDLLK